MLRTSFGCRNFAAFVPPYDMETYLLVMVLLCGTSMLALIGSLIAVGTLHDRLNQSQQLLMDHEQMIARLYLRKPKERRS